MQDLNEQQTVKLTEDTEQRRKGIGDKIPGAGLAEPSRFIRKDIFDASFLFLTVCNMGRHGGSEKHVPPLEEGSWSTSDPKFKVWPRLAAQDEPDFSSFLRPCLCAGTSVTSSS